ncbi:MAG: 5-dehydro-4-deoxyglucarate dehydratase [Pyrinomonadaceae bacterium]|nr:5-dehydro-4-deoxyglucarate dehydratase [Pyrinomonadaceae bacterium]
MDPQELRSRLHGVIAFPVTPFKRDLTLNLEGLRSNLERLLEYPICAVIAPGGTGEMYSLTPAEHLQVVQTTLEVSGGRVPVLTAVGFNQQLAVEMANQSAAAGIDGILAFPPYYPNADDEGMRKYYSAIAAATPLGMLIYARDWTNFGPSMVEQLAGIPNLVAWKDGIGDIRRYQMIINRVGERLHWIGGAGDDLAPAYYGLGIRTYTSSLANIAPKLSLEIHNTASRNDTEPLNHLMSEYVVPHYTFRARRKGYEVSVVKAMMDLVGLAGGPVRPPLVNVTNDEVGELKQLLETWGPVL